MSSNIHEFVVRGGQTVTAGQMNDFLRKLPLLKVKAETFPTDAPEGFADQTRFLIRYTEDVLDGEYPSTDLSAVAEAVFALGYLLKDVDIIPDNVPGGLLDDAAVIRAVLAEHPDEFMTYSEKYGLEPVFLVE